MPIHLVIPAGVAGLFVVLYLGRKIIAAIGPFPGWAEYYNNAATIFGVAKKYGADKAEVKRME